MRRTMWVILAALVAVFAAPRNAGASGAMFKAFDLYDGIFAVSGGTTECELCAMTKEITASFWRGASTLAYPEYPTETLSDSVSTVLRGTCRTFKIPGGFTRVYIKTLPVGSDSTGVKTAWSMNWR